MPIARVGTWAFIGKPASLDSRIWRSMWRQASGAWSACAMLIDIGRPETSTMRRNSSNSCSRSTKSDTTSNTPRPASRMPRAMPSSSASVAVRLGVKSPSRVRWFLVRDVVKPSAPASSASRVSSAIASTSSAVGSWV